MWVRQNRWWTGLALCIRMIFILLSHLERLMDFSSAAIAKTIFELFGTSFRASLHASKRKFSLLFFLVTHFWLKKKVFIQFDHTLHSTEVTPSDFWLFPKINWLQRMKICDHWRRFNDVPQVLKKILKEEFWKCSEQWQCPWNKGVASRGDWLAGRRQPSFGCLNTGMLFKTKQNKTNQAHYIGLRLFLP